MALGRLQGLRSLCRTIEIRDFSYLLGSLRSYSNVIVTDTKCRGVSPCLYKSNSFLSMNAKVSGVNCRSISSCSYKGSNDLLYSFGNKRTLRSTVAAELLIYLSNTRFQSTQVKAPPQARQMGAFQVSMTSPGIIYEPYAPREPIPFWRRWFTRSGWRRTKDDIILELKSAYAVSKLRKSGYSKQKFYKEALEIYKEINSQMANGDKTSLRKAVTEKMYSALKNEIKQRESMWSKVYWELVEPVIKIRTLRARLIGVDRSDFNKVFIQLTLEFLTKQKFEAYDLNGAVVAGDKDKEVLVKDIWIFEKSLFHPGAYWRLCGRIKI